MDNTQTDELPLLFGKWKQNQFDDFSQNTENSPIQKGHESLSLWYKFDFTTVRIESSDIYYPQHKISAMLRLGNLEKNTTIDTLFHPEFAQMYQDGIVWMQKKLNAAASVYPQAAGIDVKDHSRLIRESRITVNADYETISGGFADVKERDRIVGEVYLSLEHMLETEFGIVESEVTPSPVLGPFLPSIGQAKTLTLANGITVLTDVVPNSDINSGHMGIYFLSDEEGDKIAHRDVYEKAGQHINENHSNKLRPVRGSAAHKDSYSANWAIDLSFIQQTYSLPASTLFKPLALQAPGLSK